MVQLLKSSKTIIAGEETLNDLSPSLLHKVAQESPVVSYRDDYFRILFSDKVTILNVIFGHLEVGHLSNKKYLTRFERVYYCCTSCNALASTVTQLLSVLERLPAAQRAGPVFVPSP